MGTSITQLVTTLELLRDTLLGEGNPLLPKKTKNKICEDLRLGLQRSAEIHDVKDNKALSHLSNKLPNINLASSTKQFDKLFNELGDYNQPERTVERNEQAHGNHYEHYKDVLMKVRSRIIQVILNRIILVLVGHTSTT